MADTVQGLTAGTTASFEKQVTAEDVAQFAQVTGDTQPLHTDAGFAARTRFKQPIAHGMLGAGVISAAIGTRLAPDSVVIYMAQNMQFRAPVLPGDTITATVTVTKVDTERSRVSLDTVVTKQDGTEVIRGDASNRRRRVRGSASRADQHGTRIMTNSASDTRQAAGGGHSANGNDFASIRAAQEEWERSTVAKVLERYPERKPEFTASSVTTNRLYSPADVADVDYLDDVGFPGQFPFTRGVQPTMYRGRLWTMRQYAGFGTAQETNQRFKHLIANGQTGLSTAFDLPTQTGYDSDDEMSVGEVGQVGVAIDSLADMETLFDGIPLDEISTSMTINAPAPILVAMYMATAEKQGHERNVVTGTAQNDVLKEYVARGTYIFPPQPSVRLAANLINFCAEQAPRFNSISVSGYHIREAGSTAAQEVAFAFSNALAYLEECERQGADLNQVAQRVSWIFNTHNHFFEEIAKYRAMRRLWARLMVERFGITNPQAQMLRTHTQTGGSTLTAQQPKNNIARAAIQALAAVTGGVQSLALSCYDEALALPTEEAQQVALRTQQIIAHESGAADTIDPLAGSYYIEHLTHRLEEAVRKLMARVEDIGGAVAAIEQGFVQGEIQEAAVTWQREVESKQRILVGVNEYVDPNEDATPIFRPNLEVVEQQLARLRRLREERDQGAVDRSLTRLREEARGDTNLMEPILEAVHAYATLGEMCGVLRDEWGEYVPQTAL